MDQLNEGLALSITGPVRDHALPRFTEQMQAWGVTLPEIEPLVLDFGLNDFAATGLIEYWIANEVEAGYCGKYLFVFDGQSCPIHRHQGKHETFFVVRGHVSMTFRNERRDLAEGDVLPVPPGTRHGFTGNGHALLLELSTPCLVADNTFEEPGVGY